MIVKTLVTFIIRLFNLVEAEAKSAKRHVVRLGVSLALAWAAVVLLVASVGLFAAAITVALATVVHPAWALAIVALLVLVFAVAVALAAKFVFGRKRAET